MTIVRKTHEQHVQHNMNQNDAMTLNIINKQHADKHTSNKISRHTHQHHHITKNDKHHYHGNYHTSNHHSAMYQADALPTSKANQKLQTNAQCDKPTAKCLDT